MKSMDQKPAEKRHWRYMQLRKPKLKVGDTIHIHGHTTDITQVVDSMQIERVNVSEAGPGDSVGIKVVDRCRGGDHVFKVVE